MSDASGTGGPFLGGFPPSDWVRKAQDDLNVAQHVSGSGPDASQDAVAFHCQQAIEKLMKAVLVLRRDTAQDSRPANPCSPALRSEGQLVMVDDRTPHVDGRRGAFPLPGILNHASGRCRHASDHARRLGVPSSAHLTHAAHPPHLNPSHPRRLAGEHRSLVRGAVAAWARGAPGVRADLRA